MFHRDTWMAYQEHPRENNIQKIFGKKGALLFQITATRETMKEEDRKKKKELPFLL